MFRHILCPLDLADPSLAALEAALALARPFDAGVTVLYVQLPPYQKKQWFTPYLAGDEGLIKQLEEREREAARELLVGRIATLTKPGDGIRIEPMVRSGVPPDVIDETALELHADLIVMGTHGRHGIKRMLLGSIAERVVRSAPCAVMTVRSTDHGGDQ